MLETLMILHTLVFFACWIWLARVSDKQRRTWLRLYEYHDELNQYAADLNGLEERIREAARMMVHADLINRRN